MDPANSSPRLDPGEVTQLLQRMESGDAGAADRLLDALYGELRSLAERFMADQPAKHTLQPTALVNEAWMRIAQPGVHEWEGRTHFVRLAARAMRSVLVDHARAKGADKRGGGRVCTGLDGVLASYEEKSLDVLALNDALERLSAMDEQLARIVELRFFGGLTIAETAPLLGISTPTVERGWRVARLWLMREMPEPT
jgi:RNA polymerase sigma factor (TIGR02999 family)